MYRTDGKLVKGSARDRRLVRQEDLRPCASPNDLGVRSAVVDHALAKGPERIPGQVPGVESESIQYDDLHPAILPVSGAAAVMT